MGSIDNNSPELTLPASWYSSQALYELERRAVFSKSWLLVTHSSRLSATGNYVRYTIAGYPFFLIRDRDGNINAFLNVCRHRAFPVVQKDEGTASILACKYHGWSYGLSGKLAKAPRFETVSGFNKEEYSLFKIHSTVDKRGFVYVNLEASESPTVSWEDQFSQADLQPRLDLDNMEDYKYDHSWQMAGRYNWKTLIDNYNECYHCSVAHPGIAATTNLTTYDVSPQKGSIEHYAESKDGSNVAPTFFFPNASITMTKDYFYLMRVVPVTGTSVSMEYEVYRNIHSTNQEFEDMDKFFKQVESEDKFLCENAQQNLNAGGYVAGPLHPHNEKGVLHFKSLLKSAVMEHWRQEEKVGEITPAKRSIQRQVISEEETFCRGLCQDEKKVVEW